MRCCGRGPGGGCFLKAEETDTGLRRTRTAKRASSILEFNSDRGTNSECLNWELSDEHPAVRPEIVGMQLLRKEVIQPHLPVRLPCYDFTPIANPTFGSSFPDGLGH